MLATTNNRLISIAPMMAYTDKHFRYLMRLISQHVLLYTEMITPNALLYGNTQKYLDYHPSQHPLAIQFGSNDPITLAKCAKLAETAGYDEVNLNIGCPSERVQKGVFGVCLMAQPQLVKTCASAIMEQVNIPVSIKCRIGIEHSSYQQLSDFIGIVSEAGVNIFIIHARTALLNFNPKQNRSVPPLQYDWVYQLKQDYPHLHITINGGVKTYTDIAHHLSQTDGVMLGRIAYQNPYMLVALDQQIYHSPKPPLSRLEILKKYYDYMLTQTNVPPKKMLRHVMHLFKGEAGSKSYRQMLTQSLNQVIEYIEC